MTSEVIQNLPCIGRNFYHGLCAALVRRIYLFRAWWRWIPGADRKEFQPAPDNRSDDIHFSHTDPWSILPEDWQIRPTKQRFSRFMSVGYLHTKKRTASSNCPDYRFGSFLEKSRMPSLCTMDRRCVVRTALPPAMQKIMPASGHRQNGGETGIAFDQRTSNAEYSFN